MDEENKLKIALRPEPDTVRRMDGWLEKDNCKSHGEFVEKVLRFYMGYLATEGASEYLSCALVDTSRGTLADSENRLHTLLFRLCVGINMMGHIVATHFQADPVNRRKLQACAVNEVLRTNGEIRFDDTLDLQRRVFPGGK